MLDTTTILKWLLRCLGAFLLLAWPAVFLTTDMMAASHRWLGMGEMPRGALVEYLTRSISVLYGTRGGVFILLSMDVVRYLPIIRYFAILDIVFGVAMFAIDLHAGMPLFWTLFEGPPAALLGIGMWILVNRIAAQDK